jgi:hypothetical protein
MHCMTVARFTLLDQQMTGVIQITALAKVLFAFAECEIATWPPRNTICIYVVS